eukprot:scaffold12034_cov155-Isochrysis_galbana.AAC.8
MNNETCRQSRVGRADHACSSARPGNHMSYAMMPWCHGHATRRPAIAIALPGLDTKLQLVTRRR